MREIYNVVKACVHRNVFQNFIQMTLIGLIAMNLRSGSAVTEEEAGQSEAEVSTLVS